LGVRPSPSSPNVIRGQQLSKNPDAAFETAGAVSLAQPYLFMELAICAAGCRLQPRSDSGSGTKVLYVVQALLGQR
jgi:hypothetical protein